MTTQVAAGAYLSPREAKHKRLRRLISVMPEADRLLLTGKDELYVLNQILAEEREAEEARRRAEEEAAAAKAAEEAAAKDAALLESIVQDGAPKTTATLWLSNLMEGLKDPTIQPKMVAVELDAPPKVTFSENAQLTWEPYGHGSHHKPNPAQQAPSMGRLVVRIGPHTIDLGPVQFLNIVGQYTEPTFMPGVGPLPGTDSTTWLQTKPIYEAHAANPVGTLRALGWKPVCGHDECWNPKCYVAPDTVAKVTAGAAAGE